MTSCLLLPTTTTTTCTACRHISASDSKLSQFPKHNNRLLLRHTTPQSPLSSLSLPSRRSITVRAFGSNRKNNEIKQEKEEEEEEVEEDMPWIQEKALDLVEFTGSVTQAIPGPRVGQSSLPWIMAVPLAYFGVTFVIAFVKTVRKFNSPKGKRRQLVNKNATLCKSIDEMFEKGIDKVDPSALKRLTQQTGFSMEEILRKYIRYALNEKQFKPDLVSSLIQFRKKSMLDDTEVAKILNDISRKIVQQQGPVVMDMAGYSEKGLARKLAVQALFGKIYYLSELPEFCSKDSSSSTSQNETLMVKELFGVTDEDAEKLRVHPVAESGVMESLENMIGDDDSEFSDAEDSSNESSESF